MMSDGQALLLVARLSGLFAILQNAELLALRPWLRHGGVWSWQTLQADYESKPAWLRGLAQRYLADMSFEWLLWFRIAVAVFVVIRPEFFGIFLLGLSGLMISIRFRGAFNGGSDSMTVLTLGALAVGFLLPDSQPLIHLAVLLIAAQVVLSYTVSGFRKLASADWRRGSAVALLILQSPIRIDLNPTAPLQPDFRWHFSRVACWSTLLFECGYPLALTSRPICLAFMLVGAIFHWLNHRIFGLNRFFWAWMITYPALLAAVS